MGMKVNRATFFIVLGLTLVIAWIAFFGLHIPLGDQFAINIPGANQMRFGIDIRGGVDAVYQPVGLDRVPTADELESARSIIEVRLDQKNILDRDVTVDRTNGDIIVRFPWKSNETDFNPQKAISELGQTAKLTFRDSDGKVLVDGSHVTKSVVQSNGKGGYDVALTFDAEGKTLFAEATTRLIGKPIAIYMDEAKISEPIVESAITDGAGVITNNKVGNDSLKDAADLAQKIAAGALPFSMEARNYSTISPSLGAGALNVMVWAGALAFLIICLFLILYYKVSGMVACVSLTIQVCGVLLALSIPQITVTLPGIAGIILSIGMGVDANIIISERISEEIKVGRKTYTAVGTGFKNAFSSVFDGNITVMIAAIILMILGSGAMLSFAYSMLTGIILNFLAGVTASHLMMRSLILFPKMSNEKLYTCRTRRVML
jgi:protein-export SecD/SecF family membrane protein